MTDSPFHPKTRGQICGIKNDQHKGHHVSAESVEAIKFAKVRYNNTPKGKAAKARDNASSKGKAAKVRYRESGHGQLVRAQYEASVAGFLSGIRHNANQRGNR